MFKTALTKPDGRALLLYSRRPIPEGLCATSPQPTRTIPNPHLRWHPLRGEWVAYADYRQNRTFLPPVEFNPLAPTTDPQHPTELPAGDYDAAVFENLFPTFAQSAGDPPQLTVDTRPAVGACEVIVFTQDPSNSFGMLPVDHIALILEVWADRHRELGAIPDVNYVMPFENRGVEVGVTLHHPHGQIYAYPFVPPVAARELALQREHFERHSRGLLEQLIDNEVSDGHRLLYAVGRSRRLRADLCALLLRGVGRATASCSISVELSAAERREFARALKTVLLKFDGLWNRPFPYVMAVHQAPTDGESHPEAHLHVEFYPAYRMRDRLKYLAGSELGAGVFTADTLPETKAAELRAVEIRLD